MSWLRNSILLAGAVTSIGLSVTSCAENESMLFVVGVLALEESDCVASPDSSSSLRSGGVLDLSLAANYRAAVLVGSQLTQRGSRDRLRTETARLNLEGAEITLEDRNGPIAGLTPNPFTSRGTGLANPAAGTEPGYAAMYVDLIPASIGPGLASGIVAAKVRVFGTTLGGQAVESNEFRYPIQICRGCLVSYAEGTCEPSTRDETAEVCYQGQDQLVQCAACSSFNDVCTDVCKNCDQAPYVSTCPNPVPGCP